MSTTTCRQCVHPMPKGVHTCAPEPLDPTTQELVDYMGSGQPAVFLADHDRDELVIRPHGTDQELRLTRVFARYLRHGLSRAIEQLEKGRPTRG